MVSPLGDDADHLSIDLHLKFFCVQTKDRRPFSHGIADIPVLRRVVFHKKSESLLRLPALSDHGHTPASDDGLVVCGEAARVFFIRMKRMASSSVTFRSFLRMGVFLGMVLPPSLHLPILYVFSYIFVKSLLAIPHRTAYNGDEIINRF